MKKFLSAFLALAMVFAILPTGLFSINAKAATSGYYTYYVSGGKATITDVDASISGDITIPSTLGGYPVTAIGYEAFYHCTSLTIITIPDSIESIGESAFWYCTSLTSVTIPDSVTSIGNSAFRDCDSLTSVTIPDSVTSIGKYAFSDCTKLTSVTIPDSVTSIESYAFCWCDSLTSITIPKSVNHIGSEAFRYCKSLANITISDSVETIGAYAFHNTAYYNSSNWVNKVLYIGNHLIDASNALSGDYTVKNGTKTIGNSAFEYCTSLTSITIPDSVTSIGSSAFYNCTKLTSVTIGNSVTSIGGSAFSWCTSLTGVTIPDSVTSIGGSAFYECTSLTSVTIPDSVTSIGGYAFDYCTSLTSVTIGNGITSIGSNAFYYCASLNAVYITDIASWCNISFGNNTANPLYYTKNLYLNGELVTNLVIPDSVTSIGGYAFEYCTSLTSITIPDSVTSIGDNAFLSCTSLTSITIPDGVTSIGRSAFYNCKKLTCITIPDSVTSIGNYAFCSGEKLTSVTIGNGVTTIGDYVFSDCGLTGITIPDSVTSIGNYAFYSCDSLTSITIPDSVTSIGSNAFDYCTSLKTVYHPCTISKSDITIASGNNAFENATWEAINHDYAAGVVTHPTCQTEGYTTFTCKNCADSYIGDFVDNSNLAEVEHNNYTETSIAPTASSQGYTLYTCEDCGYSYKDNFVSMTQAVSGVKTTPSDIGVTLSWDSFEGAVKYFATVCAEDGTSIKTIVTTETSAFFGSTILDYNTNYKFYVLAQYDGEKYLKTENATKVDGAMVIGNRVVGHTATIKGKGAEISFLPAEGATEYYAYVFENDVNGTRVYTRQVPIGTTSVFIENNIVAGTKYFVLINPRINGKFLSLEELKATAVGVTFTAPVYNPTSVTVVDQTATSIRFNWDRVRGATQYFIKVTEKESGKVVNTLNIVGKETATLARHTDGTRISPNTTYILQFYTYIDYKNKADSYGEPIEITTIDFEDVTVTARYNQNNNKINVSWNKTTNAVGYYLCFFKNGVETNVKYIDGGDKTVYEFIAPKEKGTYSYGIRVYEKNSSGTAYSPISMSNAIYM